MPRLSDEVTDETGYKVNRNSGLLVSLPASMTMYPDLPPAGGPYTYEVEEVNACGTSGRAPAIEAGCP